MSRSPYDQKLSEAKAQEQQEIQAALRDGCPTSQIISGHGSVSTARAAVDTTSPIGRDNSHSPLRSTQPIRVGGHEPGRSYPESSGGMMHSRNKSIERDNKDSPQHPRITPRSQAMGGTVGGNANFQGTMGSHLTPTENNK